MFSYFTQKKIFDALKGGDSEELSNLLMKNPQCVGFKDQNGNTPLHSAAELNLPGASALLVSMGASVSEKNNDGYTPLHLACFGFSPDAAEVLMNNGADADEAGNDGRTAVFILTETILKKSWQTSLKPRELFFLELLTRNGINRSHQALGTTPLHMAAASPCLELLKFLCQKGADPNLTAPPGTPLHQAARFGHVDNIAYLVLKGAYVNSVDSRGRTPLDLARENGHVLSGEKLKVSGAK